VPERWAPCREERLRIKDVILTLLSLALIGGGTVLIAAFFLGPEAPPEDFASDDEMRDFNAPILEDTQGSSEEEKPEVTSGPEDKTLWLTVPKMTRVWGAIIPSAEGNDEEKLRDYAAIRLEDTGFPWEEGANVYIAGHRLGYPNTASFLAFYDLDDLAVGDEITLIDAEENVYTYRVSKEFIVSPTDFSVTEPVKGKDILTLQTCTLPDYSQRLVVQAEKVV
jgi:sortase A